MATLKELSELIVDCEHKTAPIQVNGYPSIRTPNIGRGRLLLEGVHRVSEETYNLWTQREEPKPGDLILAREAPIGNVAIIPPGLKVCLGQRTVLIRPDTQRVNPQYLTYLLLGDELQGQILGKSNGATVHHLNMSDIRSLEIPPLPSRGVQARIASILSTYDDLIENNTRRIKILEQMAQMLYREWFVNFRFPGHEKVKMVESEMGLIPEAFKVTNLGALTSVITKGTTPTTLGKSFVDTGVNFVKVESISESGSIIPAKLAHIDTATDLLLKRSQLQENDILYSIAGAIGRVTLVPSRILPANTNQALAIIRCSDESMITYLLQVVRSPEFLDFSHGHVVQTAQANVSLSVLKSAPVLLPPRGLLASFTQIVRPIQAMLECFSTKIENLRTTRDLLLPKLVSGEVSVEALEEEVLAETV